MFVSDNYKQLIDDGAALWDWTQSQAGFRR